LRRNEWWARVVGALLCLAVAVASVAAAAATTGAAASPDAGGAASTSGGGGYRHEFFNDSHFNGPALGVWQEYDPQHAHSWNQRPEVPAEHRHDAVPWSPGYGYAQVRRGDLSLSWYYYDPSNVYGRPEGVGEGDLVSINAIPGYVPFSWSGPPHPYNVAKAGQPGTGVPAEARDLPYPYGVALVDEEGRTLGVNARGDVLGPGGAVENATTGVVGGVQGATLPGQQNIFAQAWDRAWGIIDQFWEFLGQLFGVKLGPPPWRDFQRDTMP